MTAAFAGSNAVVSAIAGDPHTIVSTIDPIYAAAEAAGVRRIVYLSSAVVHGHAPPVGTDESSELSLDQPLEYNRAKILAERRLIELHRGGAVEVVILRPGIVYGPGSQWTRRLTEQLSSRAGACQTVARGFATPSSSTISSTPSTGRFPPTEPTVRPSC